MSTSVGALIGAAERGEAAAVENLFTTLYSELHSIARRELARRGAGASLGVTTLLHEAYLDMAARQDSSFPDRNRFLAYAARVMRGLIVDHARNRKALKRGGQFEITCPPAEEGLDVAARRELIQIGDALEERSSSADSPLKRSPACAASPTGPCSACGKRRAFTCTAPFVTICPCEALMPIFSPETWKALSPHLDRALDLPPEDDDRSRRVRGRNRAGAPCR